MSPTVAASSVATAMRSSPSFRDRSSSFYFRLRPSSLIARRRAPRRRPGAQRRPYSGERRLDSIKECWESVSQSGMRLSRLGRVARLPSHPRVASGWRLTSLSPAHHSSKHTQTIHRTRRRSPSRHGFWSVPSVHLSPQHALISLVVGQVTAIRRNALRTSSRPPSQGRPAKPRNVSTAIYNPFLIAYMSVCSVPYVREDG